eukprot:TRINITY_DN11492_c4_g1_i3.p3 TRINITY_DN11492_c4_g1~~TRINITY_DN11492_c4_g1_i3.p3  ORF type:complete len:109 (+),score=32.65 TRINITY_DN11492_c4_g1_i3:1588-1914(+)
MWLCYHLTLYLTEQNIRILAQYYERLGTGRMAELLNLEEADAERYLSTLVTNGTVTAKIDRPAKIIVFQPKKRAVDVLNSWTASLSGLMSNVDKATHLMNKERMNHQA